jgi:outer membrane protein OmpA-like peptidoglycan-associated protein/tetratricopeptide (TPR) repeat protein
MNKNLLLLTLVSLLIFGGNVNAQRLITKNDKKEDPVSKLPFKKKLRYADKLFEQWSYYTAEEYYKQLLKEQPRNPYVHLKLAEALRYNRDYGPAAAHYRNAYDLASAIYTKAPYKEGLMRKMNGEYEEAISRFELFKKRYKAKDRRKLFKQVDKDIAGCRMAMKSILNPERAYIKNAGPNVNSAYTDYAPLPLGDTALLFATMKSNKILYKGKDKREDFYSKFKWAPKEFDRTRVKDSFEVALDFKDDAGRFKSKSHHIGNGSWSPGGDRFYYTKCVERDSMKTRCEIWVATFDRKNGLWAKPKRLKVTTDFTEGDPNVSTTNPHVAYVGKKEVLFFSSNRKLQGVGGYDIWYSVYDSTREEARQYRRPQNCGKRVNSVKDEITPYYDTKGGKLYWSSDGLIGVGGFDVFCADGGPSRYYNTRNLGFPINSPADDMYYIEDKSEKQNGYIVSNRLGSYYVKNPTCCDDIWRVIKEPSFYVRGRVIDEATNELIDQAVIKMTNESSQKLQDTFFSKTGNFMMYTPIGSDYSLAADKEGYVSGRTIVNTSSKSIIDPDDTTTVTIYMSRGGSGATFTVKNVYHDFDKGDYHNYAGKAMDSLVNFMKDNPSISVEIRSFTDSRGGVNYNKELSLKRAKEVLDYLTSKGVDRSRMIARGMGESDPRRPNTSEANMQRNRRTEFRIIGDVPGKRIIYDDNRPEYIDKSGAAGRRRNNTVPDSAFDE